MKIIGVLLATTLAAVIGCAIVMRVDPLRELVFGKTIPAP